MSNLLLRQENQSETTDFLFSESDSEYNLITLGQCGCWRCVEPTSRLLGPQDAISSREVIAARFCMGAGGGVCAPSPPPDVPGPPSQQPRAPGQAVRQEEHEHPRWRMLTETVERMAKVL